jgi:hypothetical protein
MANGRIPTFALHKSTLASRRRTCPRDMQWTIGWTSGLVMKMQLYLLNRLGSTPPVGLQEELQSGVFTCCQIAEWADEQWLAWLEAAEEDGRPTDDVTKLLESDETKAALVPVRLRRPQVPRYRNPDNLS